MIGDPAVIYAAAAAQRCREVADDIVTQIQAGSATPVLTGALRASYHARPAGTGAEVYSTSEYWSYVEFGTSDTPAEPHVRPAVEIVRARGRS